MTIKTDTPRSILDFLEYGMLTLQQPINRKEFSQLAMRYPELQMEREANGKINIMSPIKSGSGKREALLITYIGMWVLESGLGDYYSSATGIELASGAIKSPDCAWVSDERLAKLPRTSTEDWLQVVPDFVVELRSKTDRIKSLQAKMTEVWMANGVQLGWLIDPYKEKVWIYRQGQETEVIEGFSDKELTGEDIMPGMRLPLDKMKVKG